MNLALLDNPGWHALNGYHRHLAIRGKIAARYQPETFLVAAVPENNPLGFIDLRNLVEIDEVIAVFGKLPDVLPGWEILESNHYPQMICDSLKPASKVDVIRLTAIDVPEMLELIAITQPGPFLRRTIELGQYIGIRQDGQLVAMAGERLHMTGFCEVSAVCTHPDYRGRGYGGALTTIVAEGIIARGEMPFLHIVATNENAKKLYTKLGFRIREEIQLNIMKGLA